MNHQELLETVRARRAAHNRGWISGFLSGLLVGALIGDALHRLRLW